MGNRHWPREALPNLKKENCGDQFHRKIAECDFAAAVCAAAAQREPTDQGQILMPRDRLLASRTKRAARFIDGKIERQPINADVQERADHGTENEGKRAEKK